MRLMTADEDSMRSSGHPVSRGRGPGACPWGGSYDQSQVTAWEGQHLILLSSLPDVPVTPLEAIDGAEKELLIKMFVFLRSNYAASLDAQAAWTSSV